MFTTSKVLGRTTAILASAVLLLGSAPALADTTVAGSPAPHERIVPVKPPRDLCPGPVPPPGWAVPLHCQIIKPPRVPLLPHPIQPPLQEAAGHTGSSVSYQVRTVPDPWPSPTPWPIPEPWPVPGPWPHPWPHPLPGPTFPVDIVQAGYDLDNPEPGMPVPEGIGGYPRSGLSGVLGV